MAFSFADAAYGINTNSAAIDTRNGGGSTAINDGDFVILFVTDDDSAGGAITWPSGFTNRSTQALSGPDGHAFHIATKQAGASEPDTYTITSAGGFGNMNAIMIVDDDLDESTISVGTWATNDSGVTGAQTVTHSAVTASAGDTVYAYIGTDDTGASDDHAFTPPTGYTELIESFTAGAWSNGVVSELDGASAGSTGAITQSVTFANTAGYAAVLVTVGPASSGSVFDLNAETGSYTVTGVDASIGAESPTDTITATDQTNNRIFQRSGSTRNIVFSGTNTGETPDNVQVQLYASDGTTVEQVWTELTSATIDASTFTGTLSVPEGGMYRFAVRSRNSSNTVLATSSVTTNLWGVGDNLLFTGDSDVFRIFSSDSASGLTSNTNVRRFDYDTETWGAGGSDGIAVTIANTHNTNSGVPVGIIEAAKSGGLAEQFGTSGTTDYNKLDSITSEVGDCAWALANHGANDATGGLSNLTTFKGWLTGIETLLRTNSGASLPIYYLTVSRFDPADGGTGSLDNAFTTARQGQKEVAAANANSHYVISGLDVAMSSFHYTSAGYQNDIAPRIELAIEYELGSGTYFRGPQITALNVSGTTGTATVVNNGTALTVDTNNGLSATDDNGTLSISSVTSPDANTLTITFGATPVGTVELSYGLGEAPHAAGEGINDNTSETLPLEPLFSLEATQGLEADAETGSFTVTGVDAQLTIDYQLNAEVGTFTITGVDAGLTQDIAINAESASYTVTGLDVSTPIDYSLNAEPDSVSITGIDATLGSLPVFNLDAEVGSFAVSGTDAGLTQDVSLNAETGAITVNGVDATLGTNAVYDLNAETGSFNVTGVNTSQTVDYQFNAETGTYTITAPDATLGNNVVFNLNAETGSFSVNGVYISSVYSLNLNAQPASFDITGVDMQTGVDINLNAETGVFAINGVANQSVFDWVINAETGDISITGFDVFTGSVPLMPNASKRYFVQVQPLRRKNEQVLRKINNGQYL